VSPYNFFNFSKLLLAPALLSPMASPQSFGRRRKDKMNDMTRQMQIELESDANHRALRRCYSCGSYARPFDELNGAIRCERCAKKARKSRRGEESLPDPTEVDFLV